MKEFRINSQIQTNKRADISFLHSGIKNKICAFEKGERCEVLLALSRSLAALECRLVIFDEYCNPTEISVLGKWQGIDLDCDSYLFDLSDFLNDKKLCFFFVEVKTASGSLYIKKWVDLYITESSEVKDLFQLSFSDYEYVLADKILGGVIYHIFVDRFRRGGEVPVSKGARLVGGEWEVIAEYPEYPGAPLKNNSFYGGTLYGIIDKLDYIKSLGTTAIYLSPIFSSVSNHKYDTADYMTVDEMFGGDEALKKLIEEAKKRNIYMILDGVFNHTGDDSIYFNKNSRFNVLGAYNSKESPYYSWFDFQSYPDKYTCWWDIPILPRINPDIPKCGEYIAGENGVIDKYRSMGVYGFRLDVADELSDGFIAKIKSRLSKDGESVLYGEVWEDASNKIAYGKRKKYYLGSELDGVMNYPLRVGIIDFTVNKNSDKLAYYFNEVLNNTPKRIQDMQMNLLGSHDTIRAITAFSGKDGSDMSNEKKSVYKLSESDYALAKKRLKAAYTVVATTPGIPSVFYGDEAGLQGYSDPFCRMPYPWGKADDELLEHYRKIGEIRSKNEVYKNGDFVLHKLNRDLLIFERYNKTHRYITVFNNSESDIKLSFSSFATDVINSRRLSSCVIKKDAAFVFKMKNTTVFEIVSEE